MNILRNIPIKQKLVILMMATSFIVLFLTCTAFFLYELNFYRETAKKELLTLAKIIEPNCIAALEFMVKEDVKEMLKALQVESWVESAAICQNNGDFFASYYRRDITIECPAPSHKISFQFQHRYLSLYYPILLQDNQIATLIITANFQKTYQRLRTYIGLSCFILVTALGLTYGLVSAFQRVVSAPILDLARVANKVLKEGTYSIRAQKNSEDEIGEFVDLFNQMLEEVQYRDEALRKARKELEIRVQERTRELSSANHQLKKEITDRKRMEENLKRSEKQFKVFMQNLPGIAFMKNVNGEFIYANKEYENACSLQPFDWQLRKNSDFFPKEVAKILDENDRNVFQTKKNNQTIEKIISLRGTMLRYWLVSRFPMFLDQKKNMILGGIGIDITEKELAEEALVSEKEYLAVTLRSIGDGVITTDFDGNILLINKKAERLTGYSQEEAQGKLLGEIFYTVSEKTRQRCGNPMETLVKSRSSSIVSQECILISKSSFEYIISSSGSSIYSKGRMMGLVIIFRNITEKRHAEKEKEELKNQLIHSQKMETIGTLAGGIAHDFNNILFPILGYADMMRDMVPKDSPTQNYAERILTGARRAKKLVEQILIFSRREQQEYKNIDIVPVIQEALSLISSTIPPTVCIQKNIEKCHETVLADSTQIHQVVMNLCTNAGHAMEGKKGVLSITLESMVTSHDFRKKHPKLAEECYIKLIISDTGCGMKPATLERIFDPFFTTKEAGKGSGLGLSVVHGIITNHGGDIEVTSAIGKGTSFIIHLPIISEQALAKSSMFEKISEIKGEKCVMLVDDEIPVLEAGKTMLEYMGYEVHAFSNVMQALEAMQGDPCRFDVVITDQLMPEIDGIEFCKRLNKIRKTIPIILISGYAKTVIPPEKARELGIGKLLLKPVTSEQLHRAIQEIIAQDNISTD